MTQPGRNDACPCGSGKKYKHCCIYKSEPASTEPGRVAHRRLGDEGRQFNDIMDWTRRRFGAKWAVPAMDMVTLGEPIDEGDAQLFLPWLVYHHPLDGASPADRYLAEKGERLPAADRELITLQTQSWLSMWEVRRVEAGVGAELYDVLTHQTRFVHDVRGSRVLDPWCLILAYVVDYPEVSVLGGNHSKPLAPDEALMPLDAARRLLHVRTRPVPIERMRNPESEVALIQLWQAALDLREEQTSVPRMLQNTDGDPLLLCTDYFEVQAADRKELLRRLETLEGARLDKRRGQDPFVSFTKSGNKMHASWDNTILGRAVLRGDRLLVESNSSERADALRKRIEDGAKGLARFLSRSVADPRTVLESQQESFDPSDPPLEPRDPRALAVMRKFIESHYASWPDQTLPALGGLTPRAAAKHPKARGELIALLKEMEFQESQKDEAERYEFAKLWRALGLDAERASAGFAAKR